MINSAGDEIMHDRNRWQTWSAGFALVLAGCGQAEAPKAPSGEAPAAAKSATPRASTRPGVESARVESAAVEPAATNDQPAAQPTAQPASPASLVEATRAIDLRKFPLADGGKDLFNSAAVGEPRSGKD